MVEGARLESVYTETYRGFESLLLRHLIKNASLVEAFLIRVLMKRDESRRFDEMRLKQHLAPSRLSGEARRVKTARRLFWVIPPSPPKSKKGLSGPFFGFQGAGGVDNPISVANTRSGCRRRVPESCNVHPWAFHRTDRSFYDRKLAISVWGSP